MDENRLGGPLPSEIGMLSNLAYLDVQKNRLTGEIPGEFGELTSVGKFLPFGLKLLIFLIFLTLSTSCLKQPISMGIETDLRAHSTPHFPS